MVKQVFKFSGNYKKEFRLLLEKAQELTMDKLLQELYSHYINEIVYKDPPKREHPFYQRTYLLKSEEDGGGNLFVTSETYSHGGKYGGVYSGIETNDGEFWFRVDANPDHINKGWQHASRYWDECGEHQIGVQDFINIINNGVPANKSIFGERPATNFWTNYLEYVTMGEYRRVLAQSLIELGLDVDLANTIYSKSYTKRNRSGTIDIKVRRGSKDRRQPKKWN